MLLLIADEMLMMRYCLEHLIDEKSQLTIGERDGAVIS